MTFRTCCVTVAQGLLTTLLFFCSAPLPAQDKQSVPSAAAQEQAIRLVKEVFGEEYAAAEKPEDKTALAMKMVRTALEATEPTNRFALLRVARDIATDAGDGVTAFRAIGEMARTFDVDVIRMRASVLYSFSKQAKSTAQHRSVAEESLKLVTDSVAQGQVDLALKIVEIAVAEASQSRDGALLKKAVARSEALQQRAKAYEEYRAALEVLESNPTDPDANLTVGKYHCFVSGDWAAGLPMLALGSDAVLKKLAVMELGESPNALALGDAWWEFAVGQEEPAKAQAHTRAYSWYRAARQGLTNVLLKAKVEKRISSIEQEMPDVEDLLVGKGPLPVTGGASPPTAKLVADSDAVSAAIERALKWLVTHQRQDGSWTFATGPNPGSLTDCTETATAMALIPLLRTGQTHRQGEYKENIGKGLNYLLRQMKMGKSGGSFHRKGATMYGHGICSIALCEAYARSRDRRLRAPAQAAINYIVYAQDPKGGGWRYKPRQPGDTSVLGWQLQPLVIGDRAGIEVPKATCARAAAFLDGVQTSDGVFYGYTGPAADRYATTAIGLWSRLHLGWKSSDPKIASGVKYFVETGPSQTNYYGNYYVSCLLKACGRGVGEEWATPMRKHLAASQLKSSDTSGSWFTGEGDHGCERGGRLYCTSMALMTLLNLSSTHD